MKTKISDYLQELESRLSEIESPAGREALVNDLLTKELFGCQLFTWLGMHSTFKASVALKPESTRGKLFEIIKHIREEFPESEKYEMYLTIFKDCDDIVQSGFTRGLPDVTITEEVKRNLGGSTLAVMVAMDAELEYIKRISDDLQIPVRQDPPDCVTREDIAHLTKDSKRQSQDEKLRENFHAN